MRKTGSLVLFLHVAVLASPPGIGRFSSMNLGFMR